MSKNLLIVDVGMYGVVVSKITADMGCFEKISFVNDEKKQCQMDLGLLEPFN